MGWIAFFAGLFLGGAVGITVMCLLSVSAAEPRREERERRRG